MDIGSMIHVVLSFKDLRATQQSLTRLGMFGGVLRYAQCKLAVILYTVELAHRYPIKFVAVHPGIPNESLDEGK